jgi:thymidylate synthase (FAD)
MAVKIIWSTPDLDAHVAYIARVSNPGKQDNPSISGLLQYMMRNGHVSPFEMANVCVQLDTTRDIARQALRHRSFSFQEFSQRYAEVTSLDDVPLREARLQDSKNRQSSLPSTDLTLNLLWEEKQDALRSAALATYQWALNAGIAKEQARAVLPEGLTASRVYMNGTLRSWIHYLQQRLDPSTQQEHRLVAQAILAALREVAPISIGAFFPIE